MSAVFIELNRRTFGRVALPGAFVAVVIAIAAARAGAGAPTLDTEQPLFVFAALAIVLVAVTARTTLAGLVPRISPRERLLVIGTTETGMTLARELSTTPSQSAVEIVGFVELETGCAGPRMTNVPVIGTVDDVADIVQRRRVDRVAVNLVDARGRLPMEKLLELRFQGVPIDHVASVYERYTGKIALENLRPSWLVFSPGFRHTRSLAVAKRVIDVLVGAVLLILTAPVMAVVAVAIKISSPGPVLYRQRRVGKNGRPFTLRKFRSMRVDAEAATGAVWAIANDPRVTPIGRFLRRTRLDELPQLWNVLANDMSLVGPRPERPEFVERLAREITLYGQRHHVKPGLTGWAQISYPYGSSVSDALQKLQYDLYYLKHMSIALDLFIIAATAKTIWSRTGC